MPKKIFCQRRFGPVMLPFTQVFALASLSTYAQNDVESLPNEIFTPYCQRPDYCLDLL
jgi:hypothetical protein